VRVSLVVATRSGPREIGATSMLID
jgi:hypothetical protein